MRPQPPRAVAPHLAGVGARPLPGWWHAATARRRLAAARQLLPDTLAQLPSPRAGGAWQVVASSWTSTGTAVVHLRAAEDAAVLRLSSAGRDRLLRETAVLTELGALGLPEQLRQLLPERLTSGTAGAWAYVLDVELPGHSAVLHVGQPAWAAVEGQGLTAAERLHRHTARPAVVDDGLLRAWVDEPLAVVARVVGALPGVTRPGQLKRLQDLLRHELAGRSVNVGWIHGDLWAGNLLTDTHGRLSGVVDWDLAGPDELAVHDHLHVLVHRRRDVTGAEIGDIVRSLLAAATWTEAESAVVARTDWVFADGPLPQRVLVLLYWLRHVAAVSVQQRSYVTHSVRAWELRNVHRVLRAL